jgi:hypothetical protein
MCEYAGKWDPFIRLHVEETLGCSAPADNPGIQESIVDSLSRVKDPRLFGFCVKLKNTRVCAHNEFHHYLSPEKKKNINEEMDPIFTSMIDNSVPLAVIVNLPHFTPLHVNSFITHCEETLGVGHIWNMNPVVQLEVRCGVNMWLNGSACWKFDEKGGMNVRL